MSQEQRRTAVAACAGLGALLLAAPRPPAAVEALAAAPSSADPTGPVVAAVALLAWAISGWLSLTVCVVLLSRLPGLLGRTARALAARVAPAALRRAVEAALGLTVAVGALAPATALAAPSPLATVAAASGAEAAWDLDWPSRTRQPPPQAPATTTVTPSVTPSVAPSETPPKAGAGAPRPARPPAPVTPPSRVAPPTPAEHPASVAPAAPVAPTVVPAPAAVEPKAAGATGTVVVRPGDTLWSLAEAALRTAGTASPSDRQIAQAWPQWWAANRGSVGDDPDLLLPGTVLHPPAVGRGPA